MCFHYTAITSKNIADIMKDLEFDIRAFQLRCKSNCKVIICFATHSHFAIEINIRFPEELMKSN